MSGRAHTGVEREDRALGTLVPSATFASLRQPRTHLEKFVHGKPMPVWLQISHVTPSLVPMLVVGTAVGMRPILDT